MRKETVTEAGLSRAPCSLSIIKDASYCGGFSRAEILTPKITTDTPCCRCGAPSRTFIQQRCFHQHESTDGSAIKKETCSQSQESMQICSSFSWNRLIDADFEFFPQGTSSVPSLESRSMADKGNPSPWVTDTLPTLNVKNRVPQSLNVRPTLSVESPNPPTSDPLPTRTSGTPNLLFSDTRPTLNVESPNPPVFDTLATRNVGNQTSTSSLSGKRSKPNMESPNPPMSNTWATVNVRNSTTLHLTHAYPRNVKSVADPFELDFTANGGSLDGSASKP